MSTENPNPRLEVDPSERSDEQNAPKDKDKDAKPKDKDAAPSASSKGINPVQHSE